MTDPTQEQPTSMTENRYNQLMSQEGSLTPEEIKEGWHFCWDWDGLLIHPGDPEMDACRCGKMP